VHGIAGVTGGTLPAQIWHAYMTAALQGQPAAQFANPGSPPYERWCGRYQFARTWRDARKHDQCPQKKKKQSKTTTTKTQTHRKTTTARTTTTQPTFPTTTQTAPGTTAPPPTTTEPPPTTTEPPPTTTAGGEP